MLVMEVFFFVCLFMVLYPYIFFPLLAVGWSRIGGRPWHRGRDMPNISLIVSVFNEEDVIRKKIENALALDYPENLLEIVIVSDGSTDDTHQIVTSYEDKRVVLKAYERAGKTACLNRAVAEVRGEILVFTDANSMFPRPALREIARNFFDTEIGLVTGWTQYQREGSGEVEAPGVYSRLEKITKAAESLISSCVGADGAIFAVRKELYRRLEEYDINDFVIPLNVLGQGKRVILDPEVYCIEEPSEGAKSEFRRQVRMTNRTLGAISRNLQFLNPVHFGSFAFFLLSHKVLRFMVPFFSGGLFLFSFALRSTSAFYMIFFISLCLFILLAMVGLLGAIQSRVINLCATFLLTNLAQLVGWARFLTGKSDTLWTPQR